MQGMSGIILTDGGMGQELLRRSHAAPTPLWSARVLIDEPHLVRELHAEFIDAGARVITINAYAATPERLAREGAPELFEQLQRRAIDLAEAARADAREGEGVLIAGCLPPLFGSYHPRLTIPYDQTLAIYRCIVAQQAERVDLMLCETMASAEEAHAAATAAAESGRPVWVSWTLADDGAPRLRSGETLAVAAAALEGIPVAARLVNCSRPEAVTAALPQLVALGGTVGAYANAFTAVDALHHGGTVDVLSARDDLGPGAYADAALGWVEAGATIVGGCCEVGPAHIAALRDRLAARATAATELRLEAADTPASAELQRAYFADIAGRYPGWRPDLIPSADPAEVAPPVGAWVVAYLGGRPVGCGGIKRLDDESAELKRIYLGEAARGHGLGRRLLEELERHARVLGYTRVRLDTGDRQPEALGLFRSAGYREIADYNGNTWATYWMEKQLG
jgi:S-methylmethionine-dependent homocysteine/selenocysteine methylase/GNAT superfamily N-acetyltransferase